MPENYSVRLTPTTRADLLRFNIGALLAMGSGEDISLAQTFALASAIGPYLLELFTDKQKGRWLRLSFRDDPKGTFPYVTAPDGGPDGAYDASNDVPRDDAAQARQRRLLSYFCGSVALSGNGPWLPPEWANESDLSALVRAGLLERPLPPNADCFAITEAGIRAVIEGSGGVNISVAAPLRKRASGG